MAKGRKQGIEPQDELAEIMATPVAVTIEKVKATKKDIADADAEVEQEQRERLREKFRRNSLGMIRGGGERQHRINLKVMKEQHKKDKMLRAEFNGKLPTQKIEELKRHELYRGGFTITTKDLSKGRKEDMERNKAMAESEELTPEARTILMGLYGREAVEKAVQKVMGRRGDKNSTKLKR
jgi:hypothetical protein